ncbi:MAG: choice-of-anchor D domain-containing protein [Nitrospirae bacterium]|nr:choice-of-anchor D domain-containing protein [Nitrospirota bacterium]
MIRAHLTVFLIAVCLIFAMTTTVAAEQLYPGVLYSADTDMTSFAIGDVNNDGRRDVSAWADGRLAVFLQNAAGMLNEPVYYSALGSPSGAVLHIADINGDGRNDVVIGITDSTFNSSNRIGVYLQNSIGQLESPSMYPLGHPGSLSCLSLKSADMNNDGHTEIVALVGNEEGMFIDVLAYTSAAGLAIVRSLSFPAIESATWPIRQLTIADMDSDGMSDILFLISGYGLTNTIGLIYQHIGGVLSEPLYYTFLENEIAMSIAVSDVNRDGRKDVITVYGGNRPTSFIAVLYQNDQGGFEQAQSYATNDIPVQVEVADIDGDGNEDIVVMHDGGWGLGIYLSGPARPETIEIFPLPFYLSNMEIGDISGDGRPDILFTYFSNEFFTSDLAVYYHRSQSGSPDIAAYMLDFQTVFIGAAEKKVVGVCYVGPSDLFIGGVSISGDAAGEFRITADGCSGKTIILTDCCPVEVEYSPRAPGPKQAGLLLSSNDPDSPQYTFPFTACGTYARVDRLFSSQTTALPLEFPYPEAARIGDLNYDGRKDVVVIGGWSVEGFYVFLQDSAGNFSPPVQYIASTSGPQMIVAAEVVDLNNDGKDDVVLDIEGGGIMVFLQNNSGSLDPGIVYSATWFSDMKIKDVNNDGRLDIIGLAGNNDYIHILYQGVDGGFDQSVDFGDSLHNGALRIFVEDLNDDGLQDIILLLHRGITRRNYHDIGIFYQQSDGTFAPLVSLDDGWMYIFPDTLSIGDVNNDGLKDIVVSYANNPPYALMGVYYQEQAGTFAKIRLHKAEDLPILSYVADISRDGKNDIIAIHPSRLGVFRQDDYCPLSSEELYEILYLNYNSISFGDVNNDGLADVVLGGSSGATIIYQKPIAPEVTVSPALLDFSAVIINTQASQDVRIINSGRADLALGNISLDQNTSQSYSLSVDGCSGKLLKPSAGCKVTITFVSDTIGSKTATMLIPSNDPVHPLLTVSLSGTVVLPAVTLLSPLKGEILNSGSTYVITWSGPAVYYDLKYKAVTDVGGTWKEIAYGLTSTQFTWTVPVPKLSEKYFTLRITGFSEKGEIVGISSASFRVRSIRVISPNGAEIMKSGDIVNVAWQAYSTRKPTAFATISYTKNGGSAWTSAGSVSGTLKSYPWRVPKVARERKRCKIKVVLKDVHGNVVGQDASNAFFTITP